MRIDNNSAGLNILEEQARAREIKNANPTPKVKISRANQNTAGLDKAPNFGSSGPAPIESKIQMGEIINFEEAKKILKDTEERSLSYPNDLIQAQANNKPETILKLIS